MIGRLFIVLVLCGALGVAASWNTSGIGFAAKTSSEASQPDHAIMTVAIEPDRAPPAPARHAGWPFEPGTVDRAKLACRAG